MNKNSLKSWNTTHNSAKQTDLESIKAIDKYLKEMCERKSNGKNWFEGFIKDSSKIVYQWLKQIGK